MAASDTYELFALRYATREGRRGDHFLGGDPDPDRPMAMDYFVWVAANGERTVLIDTGFKREVGERRGRTYLRRPLDAVNLVDTSPSRIEDVIVTHMHYDHAGTLSEFRGARLHLQEKELQFVTSRQNERMRGSFEIDDVTEVVRALYEGRIHLHDGSAAPWPGISVHLIGGHTAGTQAVRVRTRRGFVVLTSDASHYYENIETDRPFATTHDAERVVAGFKALRELADSPQHLVPGHDPEVLKRYAPAGPKLEGIAVRLDAPPER